ncbi:MAG: PAS domain S-box protein [Verrucomicrobia bacterium]|nr:PAS domain S-box protein [Verrucomicrobiota bacterium]
MAEGNTPAPQDPSKLKLATPKIPEAPVRRPWKMTTILAVVFLGVFTVGGVLGILSFVQAEKERTLRDWQIQMGLVVETRAAAIEGWLGSQFDILRSISGNESQKIYIDTLLDEATPADRKEGAEGFLRNYLKRVAEQNGFVTPPPALEINANVIREGIAGIAVVAPSGQVLVASEFLPALKEDGFLDVLKENAARQRGLWNMRLDGEGQPSLGFIVPIYPVDAKDNAKPIAYVVGLKQVAKELFPLLSQPGETLKSAENLVVQEKPGTSGSTVQYLSPRRLPSPNGTKPMTADSPNDPINSAAAFALSKPGGFSIRPNYENTSSLVLSRKLSGTPWLVLRTADAVEALGPSQKRQQAMLIGFILILGLASVSMATAWKHGAEIRASAEAQRLKIAAERFTGFSKFLRVITDNQPTAIAAMDGGGKYNFANRTLADAAGITPEEVNGKTMPGVIGPVRAAAYQKINKQVIDELYPGWPADRTEGKWAPQKARHEFEENGKKKYTKTDHIPLRADRDHPPGILLIEQDITEFITERSRRERMFRGLIEAFVKEVDGRQAEAARANGKLIARLARGAAEEMGLTPTEVETAELAGELLNLGTVSLPHDLLSKGGNRNEDEKRRLREAVVRSADLLAGLEFEGPVAEVIRQAQERIDGTGFPRRLSGDAILPTAKVVAVAKRVIDLLQGQDGPAQSLDQALKTVMAEAGSSLDRPAVAALVDFLDNRGGRAKVGLS